ncbi:hypothetical protein GFC29_3132 [Anoxybacillus sp. B7M1]|uniref:XkdQ/YqbQ family protein n=1 Tax=unclassified Anoxybacillus TaxID=2639704 RepID=UPI0005CCCC38|nr:MULTISPECIES: hypothetical protein [unclassified Anoxybacillus]ANB58523.1 hypothetical protein GFC28_2304 [Anoxybacillus sp. B2M1]ANB64876.1 hypothetical protein GFC29_3132 [Anoxybacillus sp. B7M1]
MIELLLVKPSYTLEIPTETITWSGQRFNAARKIDVNILYKNVGYDILSEIDEGNTVLFKWKGTELFRGTILNHNITKSGKLMFTAYDMLQYLLLNKDVYVFSKKRADQILLQMCKDFQIPYAEIVNTKYTINSLVFDSETSLYDMVLKALIETEKQTKKKYRVYSRLGKIYLQEWPNPTSQWVLETGVNIEDFTYSISIEEVATRVKLEAGEDKKTTKVVVSDQDGIKRYGVLQYYEKVTDNLNKAQLTQRANNLLSKKKTPKKRLSIEGLGITELTSGMPVYVNIPDAKLRGTYFIASDTHTFAGRVHKMSLDLITDNSLPEDVVL